LIGSLSLNNKEVEVAAIDPLAFANLVDPTLHERSGKVFCSGRAAFSAPARLYLLGLNPGGSPTLQANETIGRNPSRTLDKYTLARTLGAGKPSNRP
jgi:hypothetical protein